MKNVLLRSKEPEISMLLLECYSQRQPCRNTLIRGTATFVKSRSSAVRIPIGDVYVTLSARPHKRFRPAIPTVCHFASLTRYGFSMNLLRETRLHIFYWEERVVSGRFTRSSSTQEYIVE
jgi:hypothetical protein